MNGERNLGHFDLTVAQVLLTLDHMFLDVSETWKPIIYGARMSVRNARSQIPAALEDKYVDVYPAMWPEGNWVNLRVMKHPQSGWSFEEGILYAPYVTEIGDQPLHFKLETAGAQPFIVSHWHHPANDFVGRARDRLFHLDLTLKH